VEKLGLDVAMMAGVEDDMPGDRKGNTDCN